MANFIQRLKRLFSRGEPQPQLSPQEWRAAFKAKYHAFKLLLGANNTALQLMTDMEAAIGLVQLKKIKEYTRKRRENAAFLDQRLGALRSVVVPFAQAHVEHSYHQYTILFEGQGKMARDEMVQRLRARGIDIGVHYPIPLHLQPVFLQGNREILPVSEAIAGQCLSLPVHPFLSQRDLEKIVAEIEQIDEELN